MGENQKNKKIQPNIKFEPQFLIFLLSLVILITLVIVFARPVYPASLYQTVEPSSTGVLETPQPTFENGVTPSPTLELEPPTPEEIGYTDGIIFWATVLVIILLVGTLRETLRRKGE